MWEESEIIVKQLSEAQYLNTTGRAKDNDLEIFYELLGKQEDLQCKRRFPSSC